MSEKELVHIIQETFPNAIVVNPQILETLNNLKKPLDKE